MNDHVTVEEVSEGISGKEMVSLLMSPRTTMFAARTEDQQIMWVEFRPQADAFPHGPNVDDYWIRLATYVAVCSEELTDASAVYFVPEDRRLSILDSCGLQLGQDYILTVVLPG